MRLIDAEPVEYALQAICDRESGVPLAIAEWLAGTICDAPAVDAVPVNDEVFGEVLNCAVRYAIESKTNVADTVVMGYITPLIPKLTEKTLLRFEGDVAASQWLGDTGDAEDWKKFRDAVCAERVKRGFEPYRGWWEIETAKG